MFLWGMKVELNVITLIVRNESNQKIEKISFGTEMTKDVASIKRIKVNEEKKTTISNFNDIDNLKMTIKGCGKSYIIRERIDAKEVVKILIVINNFTEQECEYTIG